MYETHNVYNRASRGFSCRVTNNNPKYPGSTMPVNRPNRSDPYITEKKQKESCSFTSLTVNLSFKIQIWDTKESLLMLLAFNNSFVIRAFAARRPQPYVYICNPVMQCVPYILRCAVPLLQSPLKLRRHALRRRLTHTPEEAYKWTCSTNVVRLLYGSPRTRWHLEEWRTPNPPLSTCLACILHGHRQWEKFHVSLGGMCFIWR